MTGHEPVAGVSGGCLREHELLRRLPFVDPLVVTGDAVVDVRGYDVVHVERFFFMRNIPPDCAVPILLVEQNIEYQLLQQRGDAVGALRMRSAEAAAWRRASMCVALTEEDRAEIVRVLRGRDVRLVPDGADHLLAPPSPRATEPTLAFVANFAYAPNVDATEWLLAEIFPLIRAAVPDARLLLVGNQSDPFGGTGRVPRVEPFIDAAHVVLVPLRIGGGVKVKTLEALSRGKAIVSTPVGVQGLAGAPVALAADATSFAAAAVRLLRDARERRSLEQAARAYAQRLPTWDEAAALLAECYEDVVRSKSAAWPCPTPTQSVARP